MQLRRHSRARIARPQPAIDPDRLAAAPRSSEGALPQSQGRNGPRRTAIRSRPRRRRRSSAPRRFLRDRAHTTSSTRNRRAGWRTLTCCPRLAGCAALLSLSRTHCAERGRRADRIRVCRGGGCCDAVGGRRCGLARAALCSRARSAALGRGGWVPASRRPTRPAATAPWARWSALRARTRRGSSRGRARAPTRAVWASMADRR